MVNFSFALEYGQRLGIAKVNDTIVSDCGKKS